MDDQIKFVALHYRKGIFDPDAAWQRFEKRIGVAPRKRRMTPFYWAAAVIAGAIVAAGILFFPAERSEKLVAKAGGAIFSLPDNSQVSMKSGALVEYPKNFGVTERKVKMRGEIEFEVAHDEQKPFIVSTPTATVRVVGTVFALIGTEEETHLEVTSGSVLFTASDPRISLLCAAQTAVAYRAAFKEIDYRSSGSRMTVNANENRLSFENASLDVIGSLLSQYFDVSVVLPDDERKIPFSSTFLNKNVHEIIAIINLTLDAHLSITE